MSPLTNCIKNKDTKTNPIWLMRQAGRYLPEFREIRKKNTDFIKLCLNSDLASEITLKIKTHIHDGIILKNESFFDSVNIAEVSSRINSDCDVIMDLVQSDIPILIRSIFLTIGSFIFISLDIV